MTSKKARIRDSRGDVIFMVMVYGLLTLSALLVVYPLVYVVSASFSTASDVISGRMWLFPVNPTTFAYEQVFKNKAILSGYINSILYAIGGTALSLVVTICAAYPLSRPKLIGKGLVSKLFIFATLFSGGLIPFYLVVRGLGMVDTRASVMVPFALNVFHVILMRTNIQTTVPEEMLEAADIDGASHFRKLITMVLPLSGSILAVLALYGIVGQWNSYFYPMVFLSRQDTYPLQIVLRDILIMNSLTTDMTVNVTEMMLKQGLADVMKYALIVLASAPLLVIYPFVQKYFVKGVMMGSLKG